MIGDLPAMKRFGSEHSDAAALGEERVRLLWATRPEGTDETDEKRDVADEEFCAKGAKHFCPFNPPTSVSSAPPDPCRPQQTHGGKIDAPVGPC